MFSDEALLKGGSYRASLKTGKYRWALTASHNPALSWGSSRVPRPGEVLRGAARGKNLVRVTLGYSAKRYMGLELGLFCFQIWSIFRPEIAHN